MKQFILLFAFLFFHISLQAQLPCNINHRLGQFIRGTDPQEIHHLGNNPQIECLKNVTGKINFLIAIQRCRKIPKYAADFEELNQIFIAFGFTNGLDDGRFNSNSIEYTSLPPGTEGNLGYKFNKTIGYVYAKVIERCDGWKIKAPNGCTFYIFTKCGNAFYEKPPLYSPSCDSCHDVTINVPTEILCKVQCDTLEIAVKIYAYYINKSICQRNSKGDNRVHGNAVLWEEYTIRYLAANTVTTQKILPLPKKYIICNDTTISMRLAPPTTEKIDCSKAGDSEMIKYIEVTKRQYKRIVKEKGGLPPRQQQQ